ncbi:MAG: Integrase catalytic region [Parcubacteria group bacterium GW2011_GWA2_46_10]|nr:MAG: Integrase catalytic region [Parcubacteria group bacterium GW2011_GWA2_46_10]
MQIHNKLTNTRGFVSSYDDALRFRDMITPKAEEHARILTFWKKHGTAATKEAFGVSRPTLFRWQAALRKGEGRLETLRPQSTAPRSKRQRVIPQPVADLIIKERSYEKIGKEKLAVLLKEDSLGDYSPSTVGRMLADMKKQGKLQNPVRYSLSGKTGRMIERKPRTTPTPLMPPSMPPIS